jgi:glycosyltransferase involved in cell wall biosynthesis
MKQRYPYAAGKIVVIPNGYDPEDSYGPLPAPPRTRKVIAHVGVLYRGRHPGVLLASLDRLIRRGAVDPASIRLECIGSVNELLVPIERFPRLIELGCVQANAQWLPRAEARRMAAQADGLLLLDLNEEDSSLQVPAKAYDYILVGRPILTFTHRNSPTAALMATCGVPNVVIDPSDPEDAIDAAVLRYLAMPNTPVPPSEEFRRNHDGALQTERLAELLKRAIAEKAARLPTRRCGCMYSES